MPYREATNADISYLVKLRSATRETEQYWHDRISGYLDGTHHPHQALRSRIVYVALADDTVVGFIAGHLTRRYDCDGELEWIDVFVEYRRQGIASDLVKLLGTWFVSQECYKICVDPGDDSAREFYRKLGATDLNKHWMVWEDIRKVI